MAKEMLEELNRLIMSQKITCGIDKKFTQNLGILKNKLLIIFHWVSACAKCNRFIININTVKM